MLVVRCTARLLDRLKVAPVPEPPRSTTLLGDWCATILPLRPVHLVLLVNERTRLAAVLPGRKCAKLAERIPGAIAEVLYELGAPAGVVATERAAMADVVFAKNANRSVTGTMNDFVLHIELARPGSDPAELLGLAMHLSRTPMSPLEWGRPDEVAKRLLGIPANVVLRRDALGRLVAETAAMRRTLARPPEPPAPARRVRVFELKVTLRGVLPAVWRRVQVHDAVTLQGLHRILQTVMGWENRHLHEFVARGASYAKPDPELPAWKDQRSARLAHLLRVPGDQVLYRYDFGDGWEHDVVLERALEPEADANYPRVTAGARACPPEDCGGDAGYEHLLEVLRDPRHPEHRDSLRWVGGVFEPEAFDARGINRALRERFTPRAGAARQG